MPGEVKTSPSEQLYLNELFTPKSDLMKSICRPLLESAARGFYRDSNVEFLSLSSTSFIWFRYTGTKADICTADTLTATLRVVGDDNEAEFSECSVCSLYTWALTCHCVLLLSKLACESKFSPCPGHLVEKLINSGVAAIVTVLTAVRCHWMSGL